MIKQSRKVVFMAMLGAGALSGCSSTPLPVNEPDPAVVRLAQVAESIQKHNRDLNDIEAARYLEVHGKSIYKVDLKHFPSLQRVESLGAAWHGPLDKLIDKLSVLGGLNPPRYVNIKPAGDVIVNVRTDYRRILDMLSDAGVQAGSRANVTLKAKERLIEVEYIPY